MLFYIIDSKTVTVDADSAKTAAQLYAQQNRVDAGSVRLVGVDKVRTFSVSATQSIDAVET
jgi:hypothetical protein